MYLGIDCGTQSTKALCMGEDGQVHGRGTAAHALIERANGAREQDPAWWVEALCASAKQAAAGSGAQVQAIGVSGQQHGLVVLDEDKQVIRPAKLWNDTETAPQNDEIVRRMGGRQAFFERFGIVPLTGYTVSKLLWMADTEPENFARIRHILLPHEYLNFWLTGEMKSESGDASGTGFFDVRKRVWAAEVLAAIDGGSGQLLAALPPLMDADAIVGHVRPEVSVLLSLPEACIVSSGGGDNMMGAIGTGNCREGVVTMSLGTSSTVYSFSDTVAADPTGCVAPFCSSSGGWLPLVCTMNATNVVTGTLTLLGRQVGDIEPALAETSPGADGLVFLPFLNGERTPDLPSARGSLHGISPHNFTPAHLIRAAIEGVTFGVVSGLDLILNGSSADTIQLIGGGARSRGWRQLLADCTGASIQVPVEAEAGCLGAIIQAAVALAKAQGSPISFAEATDRFVAVDSAATCLPDPERRAAYDAALAAYRRCFQQTYPS